MLTISKCERTMNMFTTENLNTWLREAIQMWHSFRVFRTGGEGGAQPSQVPPPLLGIGKHDWAQPHSIAFGGVSPNAKETISQKGILQLQNAIWISTFTEIYSSVPLFSFSDLSHLCCFKKSSSNTLNASTGFQNQVCTQGGVEGLYIRGCMKIEIRLVCIVQSTTYDWSPDG